MAIDVIDPVVTIVWRIGAEHPHGIATFLNCEMQFVIYVKNMPTGSTSPSPQKSFHRPSYGILFVKFGCSYPAEGPKETI
jgi:hypothetical protein